MQKTSSLGLEPELLMQYGVNRVLSHLGMLVHFPVYRCGIEDMLKLAEGDAEGYPGRMLLYVENYTTLSTDGDLQRFGYGQRLEHEINVRIPPLLHDLFYDLYEGDRNGRRFDMLLEYSRDRFTLAAAIPRSDGSGGGRRLGILRAREYAFDPVPINY